MTTKPTDENDAKIEFLRALNKTQGLLEPIKRDAENPHFRSRYATLAAVNEAVMGLLSENGFVLLQGGQEIAGKPYLRTTLYHVAGHSVSFDYPLTVSDNPQHVSSSVTYARRVSICALLALSTEDDDAEVATHGVKTVSREPAAATTRAEPVSDGGNIAVFVPNKVEVNNGTGPKGPYTKYTVNVDGKSLTTFQEVQGMLLVSAKDSGKTVRVAYKKNGTYFNIIKVYVDGPKSDSIDESATF